ncbi:EamA family transporter [soil metagenome]
MWWIFALLSALFAALTALFAKMGVKNIDSNLATAVRTTVVMLLVWAIVTYKGNLSSIQTFSKNTWVFLILSGLSTGLSWLFYFKAIQLGKLSQVAPIDKLSLVLTIVFSVMFLGEEISLKAAIGASLIVAGVFLMI